MSDDCLQLANDYYYLHKQLAATDIVTNLSSKAHTDIFFSFLLLFTSLETRKSLKIC